MHHHSWVLTAGKQLGGEGVLGDTKLHIILVEGRPTVSEAVLGGQSSAGESFLFSLLW